MRFGVLLAALAALWVQPAGAATYLTLDFESDLPGLAPAEPVGLDLFYSPVVEAGGPTGNYVRLSTTAMPVATSIIDTYFTGNQTHYIFTEIISFDVLSTGGGQVSTSYGARIPLAAGTWTHVDNILNPRFFSNFIVKLHARDGDFLIDNLVLRQSFTAVPEPTTWALMMTGFGLIGVALRTKRRVSALRAT